MKNNLRVTIRKAGTSDKKFLWQLRNKPYVFKYSRVSKPVKWQEHINWITPILEGESNKELFIISADGAPAGQLRFDYGDNKEAEISISLLKEFWGKGIAKRAIRSGVRRLEKQGKVKTILAEIGKDNVGSIELFEKLNFVFNNSKGLWLDYSLILNRERI